MKLCAYRYLLGSGTVFSIIILISNDKKCSLHSVDQVIILPENIKPTLVAHPLFGYVAAFEKSLVYTASEKKKIFQSI